MTYTLTAEYAPRGRIRADDPGQLTDADRAFIVANRDDLFVDLIWPPVDCDTPAIRWACAPWAGTPDPQQAMAVGGSL